MAYSSTFQNIQPTEMPDSNKSSFSSVFTQAASKSGMLAFDFAKANPILTGVALDLAFSGGALTQKALVGIVETVGGAALNLVGNAGSGVLNWIFS
jgi:hypothetical protein